MGRIVTPYPDTPAVGPDTPDMEFLSHLSFSIWAPQPLKLTHLSHSSLSLSLSLVTLSPSHSLKSPLSPQTLELKKSSSQINPKTKEAQISVGDHLLQVFHHGVASFLSFLARRACSRY